MLSIINISMTRNQSNSNSAKLMFMHKAKWFNFNSIVLTWLEKCVSLQSAFHTCDEYQTNCFTLNN